MKPIGLRVISSDGIEASITCDGSHGGKGDYYSVVSVKDCINEKKIYGIDPLQAFSLGWALIEDLTTDKRIANDGLEHSAGDTWLIESFLP